MPSESAQDLCLTHLRDEILSGRLSPGQRIRPDAVAAQLGISRMPVREALHQLDAEGLVTLRPNRGAIVTVLEREALAELFEMRAVLEGLCARHATRRATPADLEELDAEAQAMRRLSADPARWLERHDAFHDRICALARRPRIAAEAQRLRRLLQPTLRAFLHATRDPETLGHEHEVIVDALRDRDARRAERMMIAHVNVNAEAVLGTARPGMRFATRPAARAR